MLRRPLPTTALLCLILVACGTPAPRWVAFEPAGQGYREVVLATPLSLPPARPLRADFDADGVLEDILWENGQVRIERDGEVVWQSEPQWRVVDVAAGDIWNDLRQEVIMALWKDDAQGVPRSHPFIAGHRHGRYDLLWGGSQVADPIYDLDLGDVDGDGQNELVVLEGKYGDPAGTPARFVTVWRWNGWGFVLFWRSAAGRFQNLRLLDMDGGGEMKIVVQEEH